MNNEDLISDVKEVKEELGKLKKHALSCEKRLLEMEEALKVIYEYHKNKRLSPDNLRIGQAHGSTGAKV